MSGRCYVCGSVIETPDDPRNPLCEGCSPVRDHKVSIQRAPDPASFAAVCKCGWRSETETYFQREDAIEAHWRSAIEGASQ